MRHIKWEWLDAVLMSHINLEQSSLAIISNENGQASKWQQRGFEPGLLRLRVCQSAAELLQRAISETKSCRISEEWQVNKRSIIWNEYWSPHNDKPELVYDWAISLSCLTWGVHFVSWTLVSGCTTCNQSITNFACIYRNNSYSIYTTSFIRVQISLNFYTGMLVNLTSQQKNCWYLLWFNVILITPAQLGITDCRRSWNAECNVPRIR